MKAVRILGAFLVVTMLAGWVLGTACAGAKGEDGAGIEKIANNGDGTFTFTLTDGSTYTTDNLTGPTGEKGQAGVGIQNVVNNGNGTFTLILTDGSAYTTDNLTGPCCDEGDFDVSTLKPSTALYVGTTNSLYGTGLWGYLEPMFEEKYNASLHVLSMGSGAAFAYGISGDVDVLIVHDKPSELDFISDNYGVKRIPFAYNHSLIVGPEGDPADIDGLSAEEAFKKLADNPGIGKFVPRGDNSGTHGLEKRIWSGAGYSDYEAVRSAGLAAGWYIDAGAGMESTLQMASQLQAYTLTDMFTWLSCKAELSLVSIVGEGAILLNVYSVIVCTESTTNNPSKRETANDMVEFLASPEIQELIGKYGVNDYGMQLFTPCYGSEPTA